jgi:hypothetical protein
VGVGSAHFIKLLPDAWRRYQVASEVAYHELAVEALIELRHRRGLIEYLQRRDVRRPEHAGLVQHAEDALRSPVRPWCRHRQAYSARLTGTMSGDGGTGATHAQKIKWKTYT